MRAGGCWRVGRGCAAHTRLISTLSPMGARQARMRPSMGFPAQNASRIRRIQTTMGASVVKTGLLGYNSATVLYIYLTYITQKHPQ